MVVLYQDQWLLAIAKEPGELVLPDRKGQEDIPEILKGLHPVNRLDRPVSGVVLFAKTEDAAGALGRLFRERDCQKIYWAIVSRVPEPEEGILEQYLVMDHRANRSRLCKEKVPGSKKAVLRYRLAGKSDRFFFLRIELETGRHHQIRAQLAGLGVPVRGDLKYGYPRSNRGGGISLHARKLSFVHPFNGKLLRLTAPWPQSEPLWSYVEEETDPE